MKNINVVESEGANWKITKPLNGKIMRNVTRTLLLTFLVYTYLFTNGYKIKEPAIIFRNVSFPFTFILGVFIYHLIRYKRNIDVHIESKNGNIYTINGEVYSLNTSDDYIRVVKYTNSTGSALFGIYLVLGKKKIFIVRNLYTEEYTEIVQSLSFFLGLKVVVFN